MYRENSYTVILLYLIDIDFCYQIFMKNLIKRAHPSTITELSKIYIQKNISQNEKIEILNSINQSIPNNINKKFRIRLIYNNIFSQLKFNQTNNFNDMYEILICIENRIIYFLQNYFNNFSYTQLHTKNLLEKTIQEKKQTIQMFESYKTA